jgi:hypothetical protein
MALANKATNVTKYDLGGSGDNVIADGFIKTVEKVWIDSYVFSSAATIGTGMVIDIAKIPENKKINGIEVYGVGGGKLSATSANAVAIGARYGTGAVTNGTQFLAATTYGTTTVDPILSNLNVGVAVTGSAHTIFLHFLTATPSITAGTITTIVKYT